MHLSIAIKGFIDLLGCETLLYEVLMRLLCILKQQFCIFFCILLLSCVWVLCMFFTVYCELPEALVGGDMCIPVVVKGILSRCYQ